MWCKVTDKKMFKWNANDNFLKPEFVKYKVD